MFLREMFMFETTEDDREIVSLSTAITKYLRREFEFLDYQDTPEDLGLLGDEFDIMLPGIENVRLKVASSQYLTDLTGALDDREVGGVWDGNTESIIINGDKINTTRISRIISHEIRHALDDYKSGFRAGEDDNRYDTPKKSVYRNAKDDPYMNHLYTLAKPAEINARFLEVLTDIKHNIPKLGNIDPEQMKDELIKIMNRSMAHKRIAELFPERTQSRDFRRLLSRAVGFIDQEIQHFQNRQKKSH